MNILLDPWVWVVVFITVWAITMLIRQNRKDKLFPYYVRINKWTNGIIGDSAWPKEHLGWFMINDYRCDEAEIPKLGDEMGGLPITNITTNKDGNTYIVDVYLGTVGEKNIEVYKARRKVLIEQLAQGIKVSNEDRITYDLI